MPVVTALSRRVQNIHILCDPPVVHVEPLPSRARTTLGTPPSAPWLVVAPPVVAPPVIAASPRLFSTDDDDPPVVPLQRAPLGLLLAFAPVIGLVFATVVQFAR